jgi:mono/diheme cytochrome c family protein
LAAAISLLALCLAPRLQAADVFNGQSLYRLHCEGCHGANGSGALPGTPNFATGQGLMQPDTHLYQSIRDGKLVMPGFRGVLSDYEILDVIAYLRTFN